MPLVMMFEASLKGTLDQARLELLRKLLDLQPTGRLGDAKDVEFGWCKRQADGFIATLTLLRHTDSQWSIELIHGSRAFASEAVLREHGDAVGEQVRNLLAIVIGAAGAAGLQIDIMKGHMPTPEPYIPVLPGRVVWRALLTGGGDPTPTATTERVRDALGLARESTGRAAGWRYLHWDPLHDSTMIQLNTLAGGALEVEILTSGPDPDASTIDDCELRVSTVAAQAELKVRTDAAL